VISCWGSDEFGQLSDVPSGSFAKLYSGAFHSCALSHDGLASCWGQDTFGQVSGLDAL